MKRAARLVMFGLISAWTIKFGYLFELFRANVAHDVAHPLFPSFFENGLVSLIAYLAPIPLSVFVFVPLSKLRVLFFASGFTLSAGVLMLHVNSHNDATYTCCFWVSLWLFWLATQWHVSIDRLKAPAVILGHAIVGMIFLGGFVGKLTPEYWSGETLFHIYFLQRENTLFESIRASTDVESMASMAMVLARVAIVCEGVLACALLIPSRLLCWIGIPIILCMIGVASVLLYSVLGVLIFLILACDSLAGAAPVDVRPPNLAS